MQHDVDNSVLYNMVKNRFYTCKYCLKKTLFLSMNTTITIDSHTSKVKKK